ncbi:MAG: PHP domain-containing protein [Anaerolineales bacterium]|nr:PHP domain-containing protein [Anaerolineales bacterium]
MGELWRVDFHTHTVHSKDGLTSVRAYIKAARRAGLQRVAVTDHNTIRGALEAYSVAPDLIVPGEEIMTREGELLGYYVREEIPKGLTPEDAITRLREQGAVISVSHPFDRLRRGAWSPDALARIAPMVDAVEGFNSRCLFAADNCSAAEFARSRNLPVTAGSDAHAAFELGTSGLELPPFHDGPSLLAALRGARVFGRLSSWWVHFFSTYAKWKKRISARNP